MALFPLDRNLGNNPEPRRLPETEGHRWVGMMSVLRRSHDWPGVLPECLDHSGMLRHLWGRLRARYRPDLQVLVRRRQPRYEGVRSRALVHMGCPARS